MAANQVGSPSKDKRTVVKLDQNGGNVSTWEARFRAYLHAKNASTLLIEDYAMEVKNLNVIEEQLGKKVTKAMQSHTKKEFDSARMCNYLTPTKTKSTPEDKGSEATPVSATPMDEIDVQVSEDGKSSEEELKPDNRGLGGGETPLSEKVGKSKGGLFTPGTQPRAPDTQRSVESDRGALMRRKREERMRKNAMAISKRLAGQSTAAEKRGTRDLVWFLDPLTGVDLDEEADESTEGCIHVHTHPVTGDTRRFAVEDAAQAALRAKCDAVLIESISELPAHVTAGVSAGNVYLRFSRVIEQFNNMDRKVQGQKADRDMRHITKRSKESYATFVSRWKAIMERLRENGIKPDPALQLLQLERAITDSECESAQQALIQVKSAGLSLETADKLLAAMEAPMKVREQIQTSRHSKSGGKGANGSGSSSKNAWG